MIAIIFAQSLIPGSVVDTAQALQIILGVVVVFTTAVVGTVIPILLAVRNWIVGPLARRVEALETQAVEAREEQAAERDEAKQFREEEREHRQRLEVRQAEIGGQLGLHYSN